ncbi:MAG: ABC transporter ATP-binding protein [Deltaproteobacteria bacterium]|nr:ABC transporter ATP-binding protein [Deltaproteobacteria bacterium]
MQIELRDVRRSFGRVAALKGITASIPGGARVALIGHNGSGKSTLLRVLLGMLGCEGEARIEGLAPLRDRTRLADRLAYVPQVAPRLAVPVRELVRATAHVRGLDPARFAATASELDLDLAGIGTRLLRDLSGGMRQKLLITLALSVDASLYILDEPTASLDAEARQRFFGLISRLPTTATVLLCSHRLDELRQLTTHVLSLRDGVLEFSGATEDYLHSAAASVVDVRVAGEAAHAAMAQRGFLEGANGWWRRVLPQAEKLAVLRDVTSTLNGSVVNVVVRDEETIPAPAAPRSSEEPL